MCDKKHQRFHKFEKKINLYCLFLIIFVQTEFQDLYYIENEKNGDKQNGKTKRHKNF